MKHNNKPTFNHSKAIATFINITDDSKTAHLEPDPHILHDPDKNVDLARLDGHRITIWKDGRCESEFKVTSLGATPSGIVTAARSVYEFLDSENKTINRWDDGIFPVDCGVINEPRHRKGRYDGNLYDRIDHVEYPVPGTWEWCATNNGDSNITT
ncbi:hypothetical protein [Bacillus subtilis]|uniref:hypothetical protein n=1 Tax=Bacillus subtilis TaxID=1423 RepID=UPI0013B71968|nr:hypothetical protein [Bacillus subtilis]KAF2423613.1 hypothetical protein B6K89_15800 [Bacillus subtilis]